MSNVSRQMHTSEAALQSIYLAMIADSMSRLGAAQAFLVAYGETAHVPELEAAILQIRIAFETVAMAAIAPNRSAYQSFRAKADEQRDYRKDYHTAKILRALEKINKNFYPMPLLPAAKQTDGTFHFERKKSGYLTKKRFEALYDRFGKHLHAGNPWGNNKNVQNLASELPGAIAELSGLIALHATFIQTPEFNGAWVVDAGADGATPRVITGLALGEFAVVDG